MDISPQGAGFRGTRCRRLNTRSSTSDTPSITRPHCRLACAVTPALASIGLAGMKRGGRVVDGTTILAFNARRRRRGWGAAPPIPPATPHPDRMPQLGKLINTDGVSSWVRLQPDVFVANDCPSHVGHPGRVSPRYLARQSLKEVIAHVVVPMTDLRLRYNGKDAGGIRQPQQ